MYPDRMELGMTWLVGAIHNGNFYTKKSDAHNHDMYLIDEFGQRYDHFEEVTGAAGDMSMRQNEVYEGSYFFPLPANGARNLDFHFFLNEPNQYDLPVVLP